MMIIILYNPGDGLDPWLYHSNLFFEGTQESIMASWPLPAPRTWRCKENTCFDVGHEAILSDDQKPWQAGDLFLFK
jgi:hypothetical protein